MISETNFINNSQSKKIILFPKSDMNWRGKISWKRHRLFPACLIISHIMTHRNKNEYREDICPNYFQQPLLHQKRANLVLRIIETKEMYNTVQRNFTILQWHRKKTYRNQLHQQVTINKKDYDCVKSWRVKISELRNLSFPAKTIIPSP